MNNELIEKFFEMNPDIQKSFDDYAKSVTKKEKVTKFKYKWIAYSDDGCYEEDSMVDNGSVFDTQEDCYNDMRDAAINKVFWNIEYDDVCDDVNLDESDPDLVKTSGSLDTNGNISEKEEHWGVGYRMSFHPHKIQHHSYSGLYTYEIVKVPIDK